MRLLDFAGCEMSETIRGNDGRTLYAMSCKECGKHTGYKRPSTIKKASGLCKTCFGRIRHAGKIVSEETKTKMKENHFLKKGVTHPFCGRTHSPETRAKLSAAASRQNRAYKPEYLYKSNNVEIQMRSSWEVKYAKYLDNMQIKWEYEPEYTLSNGLAYVPDFKLEDGTVVEIKGYFRQDAKLKWELFCVDYPCLPKQLITKNELKQLGLI